MYLFTYFYMYYLFIYMYLYFYMYFNMYFFIYISECGVVVVIMPAINHNNLTLADINDIYLVKPVYFNYTPFYVIITISTIVAIVLIMVSHLG